jgi:hypothetical protein
VTRSGCRFLRSALPRGTGRGGCFQVGTIESPVEAGSFLLPHFRVCLFYYLVRAFQGSCGPLPRRLPILREAKALSLCFLTPPRRRMNPPPTSAVLPMGLSPSLPRSPLCTFAVIGVAVIAESVPSWSCDGQGKILSTHSSSFLGGSRATHPPSLLQCTPCGRGCAPSGWKQPQALWIEPHRLQAPVCFPCGRYSPWPCRSVFPVSDTPPCRHSLALPTVRMCYSASLRGPQQGLPRWVRFYM